MAGRPPANRKFIGLFFRLSAPGTWFDLRLKQDNGKFLSFRELITILVWLICSEARGMLRSFCGPLLLSASYGRGFLSFQRIALLSRNTSGNPNDDKRHLQDAARPLVRSKFTGRSGNICLSLVFIARLLWVDLMCRVKHVVVKSPFLSDLVTVELDFI
jgi:hypothetical protein